MSSTWLLEVCYSIVVGAAGVLAGWWLRGRRPLPAPRPQQDDRQAQTQQSLQGLHVAAETVRCCVQQHIDCIQAIESELRGSSATEPAVVSNAVESILAANGLVQHQFDDVQRILDGKQAEIRDYLGGPYGLLCTFASLDRQKHVYRQVLESLEALAAELADNVAGHGQRLQQISNGLDGDKPLSAAVVTTAVGQIFDAADHLQHQVDATAERVDQQAERVQMQAILSHADLLTSLPNRRAFDAELAELAAQCRQKASYCTVLLVDLDRLGQVNAEYGHPGGDVILRQAAATAKQLMRGRDMVARYAGDTFAILLDKTSLHDALPVAERIRATLAETEFIHGNYPLRVTAGVGVAHLQPDETPEEVLHRAEAALRTAKQAGGNLVFWHDGRESHPVSSAFKGQAQPAEPPESLTAKFRTTLAGDDPAAAALPPDTPDHKPAALSGRSLFIANLQRRLSEWKRGGPTVSVIVLRVDQAQQLVERCGDSAESFLQSVLARLLQAVTRDMDERCEFDDGVFAVLLPGLDESNALAVAERLQSQVRQTKVRAGDALWSITASIGVAHCSLGSTVVDLMRAADVARKRAHQQGGDAIRLGEAAREPPAETATP